MNIDKYPLLFDKYDNATLIHHDNVPDNIMNKVLYNDLPKKDVPGVLKGCKYIDGKLTQFYSKQENHVGIISATRLGKTTSYVIPTILSFASKKEKRSMIISDPKGELYRHTASKLKEEGYDVKLINFRDYKHSECWNFLTPIFRKYQKAYEIYQMVEVVDDNGVLKNKFEDKIYDSQEELEMDLNEMFDMMMNDVEADIDDLAHLVAPTSRANDPYWEDAGRDVFKAFIYAMLEDSREESLAKRKEGEYEKVLITEETFSMATIFKLLIEANIGEEGPGDRGYFTSRDENAMSYQLVKNILIHNGGVTRRCIVSTFNSQISLFREITLKAITTCNSFDMNIITGDKPVAIFVNYRDESKAHYKVISMFIKQAYQILIDKANKKIDGKLNIPFYFVLDEFGNFPPLKDFETTISACAGRNIFFILIIQSYAQLNSVYGEAVANIIRDNLNVHVFFGSNNPQTLKEFSIECGNQTCLSPLSAINGISNKIDKYQFETIPLMPVSKISHFENGECIVTEANSGYVFASKLERYYNCKEFLNIPIIDEKLYKANVNPLDRKYVYKIIPRKETRRFNFDF